ncbi:hypothetical protein HZA57_01780 [Candidatus Poribacteria bacterium]|nr:hypothetical protein [Candidatus Poribacteria bacterium]
MAVIFGLVLAAAPAVRAGEYPDSAPSGAGFHEHPREEIVLVPGHDPEDAETVPVQQGIGHFQDAARSAGDAEEWRAAFATGMPRHAEAARALLREVPLVEADNLPVIARERLLCELARALGELGSVDSIPQLERLAAGKAEAVYLAPGCHGNERHLFYDYPAEAEAAIRRIRWTNGYWSVAADGGMASGATGQVLLKRVLDGGDWDTVCGRVEAFCELHEQDGRSLLGGFAASDAAFGTMSTSALEALVATTASRGWSRVLAPALADGRLARAALAAGGQELTAEDEAIVLEELTARPAELGGVALGLLGAAQDTPEWRGRLIDLMGDDRLGADAAQALLRIAPSEAVAWADGALRDAETDDAARRRAVLVLMRGGTPEARRALESFAKSGTEKTDRSGVLRRKVAAWLAE